MSTHPHFDDKGAVVWFTGFADAAAEARKAGKRLFIESGRQACGNCRVLVELIVPKPEIKDYLNAHFVALADDCDEMADEVRALGVNNMPWAQSLPFVMLTNAEGKWLGGASGATTPQALMELLRKAVDGK